MSLDLANLLLMHCNGVRVGSDEVRINCFLCDDDRRRLWVNLDRQLYHCFNCDEKGGTGKLLRQLVRLNKLPQMTANRVQAPVALAPPRVVGAVMPPEAHPLWLPTSPGSAEAYGYTTRRGVPADEFAVRQIHYTTDAPGPLAFRVLFPVIEFGQIVYWTARSYIGADPKYYNQPKERCLLSRNDCVYGLETACRRDVIYVLEGPINAAVIGWDAVALLGKTPSPTQIAKLLATNAREFVVAVDADAIGTRRMRNDTLQTGEGITIAKLLHSAGRLVRIVLWPKPKKDASDLGRDAGRSWLRNKAMEWTPLTEAYLRAMACT